MPKKRYGIMWPHMARVGTLGQRMMTQTATVQVNVDYGSEADAMQKLRVGMGTSSLFTAMFANSPLSDGDLNGYASFRGHIWTDTDNARSGLLRFVFDPAAGFEHYVEWALDVPMYFIVRDGAWIDMTAHTFRDFWTHGFQGQRATMADWCGASDDAVPRDAHEGLHRAARGRQPVAGAHARRPGPGQGHLL